MTNVQHPGTPRNIELYNNHNVYILGAGFSREAGLPLIGDFMHAMRDTAGALPRGIERDAIEAALDYRHRAAAAAYRCPVDVENIEDLFSLAEMESPGSGDSAVDHRQYRQIGIAIASTLSHASDRFNQENHGTRIEILRPECFSKPSSWVQDASVRQDGVGFYQAPLYDYYASVLSGQLDVMNKERKDTIITFNYDTLIEEALEHIGVPFSYGLSSVGQGLYFRADDGFEMLSDQLHPGGGTQILKMHGSVSWALTFVQSQSGMPHSVPRVTLYKSFRHLCSNLDQGSGLLDEAQLLIEPPTWRKGWGNRAAGMIEIWNAALMALRTATRVFIIGYSMPKTDIHFRYLMAAGLRDNISLRKIIIVNPAAAGKEFDDQLLRLFRPEMLEHVIERFAIPMGQFSVSPFSQWRILAPALGG